MIHRLDTSDLRKKVRFLESILAHIPQMVFVKEARELRFVLFNPAGEILMGKKNEELIGKNDYDFFPKDQADFFTKKDREVIRKQEGITIEEEPIQTPGGLRVLKTRKMVLMDDHGNPAFLLGISEDITDAKAHEKLLAVQRQALAIRSRSSAMSDIASAVALEVNEPNTALQRLITTLRVLVEKRDVRVEIMRETLANMVAYTEKIAKVVKTLLSVSKQGPSGDIAPVDLVELVRETVALYKEKFRQAGIELKMRIQEEKIVALCRASDTQQAVINLLENAYDAVRGLETKWVQCEILSNKGTPEIAVVDSGKSLTLAQWEKIQVSGVGLPAIRSLVETQGGQFQLDLNNTNTRFVIRLASAERLRKAA